MALELHISGPGLDVVRRLEPGDPELVLGRDAECGVQLPDPERNVSRRHLSVWLEDGGLHFRVLSVVNGVDMPFGEAPPGARGVLPLGQTLKVGDYSLTASAASSSFESTAVFDREGSGVMSLPDARQRSREDDPFGDWEFENTGTGRAAGRSAAAAGAATGDMSAFFEGLGLDPASVGPLSPGELEAMGKLVRVLLLGVLDLHAAGSGVKQDLRAEDRTMVAVKDNNPLKTDWPEDTKLRYLFGGRTAGIGFIHPERALRDLLAELLAHDLASGTATRAAVDATLREFSPAALRTRLLGGGPRLFEGVKAWDAFCKYYEEQGRDMAQWTQRLLDRHFAEAYLRESQRIKRETGSRRR